MKYTFTNEAGQNQTVIVPDDYIQRNCAALGISAREAIHMYLSDEGYISNEIVDELTQKAKSSGTQRIESGKKRKAPTRKPDWVKRALVDHIAFSLRDTVVEYLDSATGIDTKVCPCEVEITNIERVISFNIGDDKYELTLSKKRKSKNM